MAGSTQIILDLFEQINRIPRCSKKEQEISDWLVNWGNSHGFATEQDKVKNVLIRVPASVGMEAAPTVVLQGHMDMVCEKTPDSDHDFKKDPIQSRIDGDWLVADRTTLGADNGIAVALALAVASTDTVDHPALELLFTVEEEDGLTGAQSLRGQWLTGRVLLNLDSEDEGVFTVGCAGGRATILTLSISREEAPAEHSAWRVTVGGLQGGHSGIDIHRNRGNANQLVARLLKVVRDRFSARIMSVHGGSADNAIARDAHALITISGERADDLIVQVREFERVVQDEYRVTEPDLTVSCEPVSEAQNAPVVDGGLVLSEDATDRVIDYLLVMPHGVIRMSDDVPGLVETSTNFATIRMTNDTLVLETTQRSSSASQLDAIASKVEAAARLAGASVKIKAGYPEWQPQMDSAIICRAIRVYSEQFGTEPVVDVIHAGLECGIIGAKCPGMEMISLGPTIKHPHSPQEKLNIPSLEKTWQLLVALLGSFGS